MGKLLKINLMKKYTVFNNEGITIDRYTIINKEGNMIEISLNHGLSLAFTEDCGNCMDVSFGYEWRKHCDVKKVIKYELPRIVREFQETHNLGKEIPFKSLSKELQEIVINQFED